MSEGASSARGIHWTNVITVVSAAILIGTEIIGAGMATGWAIAGLFGLGEIGAYVLEAVFVAAAHHDHPASCELPTNCARLG